MKNNKNYYDDLKESIFFYNIILFNIFLCLNLTRLLLLEF